MLWKEQECQQALPTFSVFYSKLLLFPLTLKMSNQISHFYPCHALWFRKSTGSSSEKGGKTGSYTFGV